MTEINPVTPEDWEAWRELRLAALAEAPYAFMSRLADWQGDGDREQRWRERLAIPGSVNLLAVMDGQPAGIASGVPAGDGTAELISLWVSPAARGQGVADRLIAAVEQWAREVPAGLLRLGVMDGNEHAAALYRRHGFTVTGEQELMPDGRAEHIMAKDLTAVAPQ